ncbi:hypothetical protein PHYPSEUDO_000738 [Phytophthora pseudosyringae]|uniref:Uncharacterized protein n=1 Tax=Phytophthora pseudosyringae TaxID=221518 RepID=A0A8T1V389_9STRA|nr:hypothetical protein PHYPSEUDO_000738 [Phytophthora pseudosyringae]
MTQNDKSFMGGASSKPMLINAADVCSKELFESRVLARDMLTLNDDLNDVFFEMADQLGQQRTEPVENAAMMFVMPFLDGLQPNGSMNMGALPGAQRNMRVGAADVIKTRLCHSRVWPATSVREGTQNKDDADWEVMDDEDDEDYEDYEDGEDSYDVLSELMDLMGLSNDPLFGSELKYFKTRINRNPGLLSMLSMECLMYEMLGTAYDASLVEWMVQQGALSNQSTQFCRTGNDQWQRKLPVPQQVMPNTMAVHSAAIAGQEDIVRILLEADNMIDLNTLTFHSTETLAHLSVKYGHRSMLNMLRSFGADICLKDGGGKRVCDVTTDHRWSREIAGVIAEMEQGRADTNRQENRDGLLRHQSLIRAERVGKSVAAQRDDERRRELSSAAASKTNGDTNKKKSKKKGKAQGSAAISASLVVATGVPTLKKCQESLDQAAATFARLRDPKTPADDKTDDVQCACEIIKKLEGLVGVCSHPSQMNTTDRRIRTLVAIDAAQLIHMMQKFHRVDHAAITVIAVAPPQAREVLDVLEKRLLKTPIAQGEPPRFRELVQTYSSARKDMGLGHTSSSDSLRSLEWYISNTVESYEQETKLDNMVGNPFYVEFTPAGTITSSSLLSMLNYLK